MARPSKFNNSISEKIIELYEQGKTDIQVAQIIGISERTINNWKNNKPEFVQALKEAKFAADELVEASLFRRATGYSHKVEKIFCDKFGQITRAMTVQHYPPDTTAAIFWLKNRQPENWREKQPGENDTKITFGDSDEDLDNKIAELLAKAGKLTEE